MIEHSKDPDQELKVLVQLKGHEANKKMFFFFNDSIFFLDGLDLDSHVKYFSRQERE